MCAEKLVLGQQTQATASRGAPSSLHKILIYPSLSTSIAFRSEHYGFGRNSDSELFHCFSIGYLRAGVLSFSSFSRPASYIHDIQLSTPDSSLCNIRYHAYAIPHALGRSSFVSAACRLSGKSSLSMTEEKLGGLRSAYTIFLYLILFGAAARQIR